MLKAKHHKTLHVGIVARRENMLSYHKQIQHALNAQRENMEMYPVVHQKQKHAILHALLDAMVFYLVEQILTMHVQTFVRQVHTVSD